MNRPIVEINEALGLAKRPVRIPLETAVAPEVSE